MAEATLQVLSLQVPGEEPFIGDLSEAELCTNTADGRIWVGDALGAPVELGGATKNSPIGPLFLSNYADIDITDPAQLPIANTDPLLVPPGFYRELRILLRFSQQPLQTFSAYFDYEVDWGDSLGWGSLGQVTDQFASNPIDRYRAPGRKILIELSSFGPNPSWIGKVLWVNTLSQ